MKHLLKKQSKINERNRKQELSGQTPPSYKYYSQTKKRLTGSDEKQDSKTTSRRYKIQNIIIFSAILISIIYIFALSTVPRIKLVQNDNQLSDSFFQTPNIYSNTISELLSNKITNQTKLTINTNRIASQVMDSFPELSRVTITLPLASHRLLFELESVKPAIILASPNSQPYVIDKEGRVVMQADKVNNLKELELPLVIELADIELKAGHETMTKSQIEFIESIVFQLRTASLPIKNITLPLIPNELHVSIDKSPYFIKFNTRENGRLQAGAFIAVQENLLKQGITPREYIDVRVTGKVFYK